MKKYISSIAMGVALLLSLLCLKLLGNFSNQSIEEPKVNTVNKNSDSQVGETP